MKTKKARIKNIKMNTVVQKDEHEDTFNDEMYASRGNIIKVESMFVNGKKLTKWFVGKIDDYEYQFHSSWLGFDYKKGKDHAK